MTAKTTNRKREFRRFIRAQANESLRSRAVFGFIAALALIGYYDHLNIKAGQFKHLSCMILLLYGYIRSRNSASASWIRQAPFLVDLICIGALHGAIWLIFICRNIAYPLYSAPLQIALIVSCLVSFHNGILTIARNLILGIACAIALRVVGDTQLLWESLGQILIGFVVGTSLYFMMFERLLRARFEIATKLDDTHQRFLEVCESTKFDHQKAMIMKGFHEEETMPVFASDALILKLDIIGSSHIMTSDLEGRFIRFTEKIENDLLNSMILVRESPVRLEGSAFFIKRVGDAAIFSIGNPVQLKTGDTFDEQLASLLLQIRKRFDESMQINGEAPIRYCIGVAWGNVIGGFSGKQKRYDINGRAQILAERYESIRKLFGFMHIQEPQASYVVLQDKVRQLLPEVWSFPLERYTVNPGSIRDDNEAVAFWIMSYEKIIRTENLSA